MKLLFYVSRQISLIIKVWKKLSANWIISLANKFVMLSFILALILITIRWQSLPPKIPLWYGKPWGEDQLASAAWIFILPLGSLFIYIFNIVLSVYFASEYLIFAQILSLSSLLISIFSFIDVAKIIFLIT